MASCGRKLGRGSDARSWRVVDSSWLSKSPCSRGAWSPWPGACLSLPVLLALVRIELGVGAHSLEASTFPGDGFLSSPSLEITADAVLCSAGLVFEAALAMNVRRLLEDLAPIVFLAVFGLLLSTVLIGASLSAVSGVGLVACLMLGAICSATDPVAVVAIFKEVGAPKRLAILVEGESLFNDATAIVLFTLLAAILTEGSAPTFAAGVLDFLRVFLGGIAVGLMLGRAFVAVLARLGGEALAERSLTVALAYLAFLLGTIFTSPGSWPW